MFLQMQLSSIDPDIICFSIAVIISQSKFFKCSYHLSIQASDVFANTVIISRSRHEMFLQMQLSSLDPGIRCFCKCSYHLSIQASDVFTNAVIISRSRHQMFLQMQLSSLDPGIRCFCKCSYHQSIQASDVFQLQLSSLNPGFSNAVIISQSRFFKCSYHLSIQASDVFTNAVIISRSRHQMFLQMQLSSLDPGIRCFCKCSNHLSIQA